MAPDVDKSTPRAPRRRPEAAKPSADSLGVDVATLEWQRSGTDNGALEVAFVPASVIARGRWAARDLGPARGGGAARATGEAGSYRTGRRSGAGKLREDPIQWVLLRVAGDPAGRVLVYNRTEWLNFLDGAGNGEFDWAVQLRRPAS